MKLSRALFGILLIFMADQISKWWIVESVIKPEVMPGDANVSPMPFIQWLISVQDQMPFGRIEIFPFFNLVMVWNKGISFGLFNDHGDYGPLLLTLMAGAIAVGFFIWLLRCKSALTAMALVGIIGGAIGNMVDRIRFGAVVDFLDVHAFGWHWPAFNIADSTISIGIALLLLDSLFFEHRKKASVKP